MVAEVFGQAIRKCPEIQGLRMPGGTEVMTNMLMTTPDKYTDDNTCIVTNSDGLVKASN
jgi:hypothetical protein